MSSSELLNIWSTTAAMIYKTAQHKRELSKIIVEFSSCEDKILNIKKSILTYRASDLTDTIDLPIDNKLIDDKFNEIGDIYKLDMFNEITKQGTNSISVHDELLLKIKEILLNNDPPQSKVLSIENILL